MTLLLFARRCYRMQSYTTRQFTCRRSLGPAHNRRFDLRVPTMESSRRFFGKRRDIADDYPASMEEMLKEIPDELFPDPQTFLRMYPKTSPPYLDESPESPPKKEVFLDTKNCKSIKEVVTLAIRDMDSLTPANLAAAWVRIAQLLPKHRGSIPAGEEGNQTLLHHLDRLLYQTIYLSEDFSPKDLSGTILAMAKIVQNARRMYGTKQVEVYLHPVHEVFLGDAPDYLREIMRPFTETIVYFIQDFDARCLSNVCYAYALLGMNPKLDRRNTLFRSVAAEVLKKVNEFNGQDVSNTVWAFATMKVSDSDLFQSLGDAVVGNDALLSSMKPQELSNTLWSFATSNQSHHGLFAKIGDSIASQNDLQIFEPRHLSMIAWAFATANESHPSIFKIIGDSILRYQDLKSFKNEELALTVWAFATSNVHNPKMFKRIGDSIAGYRDLRLFQAQHLTMVVTAFATAKVSHPRMFKKIIDAIIENDELRSSFTNENISKVLGAFTALNVSHPDLFEKIGNAGEQPHK
ncbi:hypothetical protein ACHAW6_001838 [Cyclotella cf. meneghiniana]